MKLVSLQTVKHDNESFPQETLQMTSAFLSGYCVLCQISMTRHGSVARGNLILLTVGGYKQSLTH
jgi:hypothetical protein